MEADARATCCFELLRDGGARLERAVAIGAEMAEIKIFHPVGDDLRGDFSRGVVGKMSVPGKNALLDRPGALHVFLQKPQIVIGLKYKRPRGPHTLDDELGRLTEIGEETDVAQSVVEHDSDRVVGFVWNGEAIDLDVA